MRGIGVHYKVPIEPRDRLVNGYTLIISTKSEDDMEHYYNCCRESALISHQVTRSISMLVTSTPKKLAQMIGP